MWAPVLLDEYRIWPEDMARFTGLELRDLFQYHAAKRAAQQQQQEV